MRRRDESAMKMALVDMAEDMKEDVARNRSGDIWFLSPTYLCNEMLKDVSELNREIGVNKVNYYGNKNRIK